MQIFFFYVGLFIWSLTLAITDPEVSQPLNEDVIISLKFSSRYNVLIRHLKKYFCRHHAELSIFGRLHPGYVFTIFKSEEVV